MPLVRVVRTPRTPVSGSRTPTASPTNSPTVVPTATPPPPTIPASSPTASPSPTPTRAPSIVLWLRGIPWQWDFSGPPQVVVSSTAPYPGQNTVVLQVGQTYELHIYDDAFQEEHPHYFSGIAALGLPGAPVSAGAPVRVLVFTPTVPGDFSFLCTNVCGSNEQHGAMHGFVHVIP
jgi:heme/copper-type cytochrome/quinol oxidase subunit 2